MKRFILTVSAMLAMAFSCFAANPESDFEYSLADQKLVKFLSEKFPELNPKEDYISITSYKGERRGEKIEIPEEIEGCKVIEVHLSFKYISVQKLVVPASVVYFETTDDIYSQFEFLRDKDKPFIWQGWVDLKDQKNIPTDRKIIFLYPGNNYSSSIYLSVPELKFTWPKNWTWQGMYFDGYLGGDEQYHWINAGYKFPDNRKLGYGIISFSQKEIELSFENSFEELPISLAYQSKVKTLILPQSLKKLTKDRPISIGSDNYKGTIVFPEGANITIEPGAITCRDLSLSTIKTLRTMGYPTDEYNY